jgi:Tfp pilus assembly protein PilO
MARIAYSSLATKSLMHFLIFGGGIILFILLFNLPEHKKAGDLDKQIEKKKLEIEEQKILYPVYHTLLKKTLVSQPEGITFAKKEKLAKGDTQKISSTLQEMALKSKLQLTDFKPDVESIINDSGFLKINILVNGEFLNLQNFLVQLCQLPYLELIEQITIKPVKNTKEFRLKIWLARE